MIVFMSDRDNATGSAGAANMDKGFDLFLIRPDGGGLRKLWDSAGGLAAHPHFSPDSQHIVFTSDVARPPAPGSPPGSALGQVYGGACGWALPA